MMKTRQNGYGDNSSVSLDRPMLRSILLQRHVRARLVVVGRIGGENSLQVRFAKNQHLVEHSRRKVPIRRSAIPFFQGEFGEIGLSRIPMALTRRWKTSP